MGVNDPSLPGGYSRSLVRGKFGFFVPYKSGISSITFQASYQRGQNLIQMQKKMNLCLVKITFIVLVFWKRGMRFEVSLFGRWYRSRELS